MEFTRGARRRMEVPNMTNSTRMGQTEADLITLVGEGMLEARQANDDEESCAEEASDNSSDSSLEYNMLREKISGEEGDMTFTPGDGVNAVGLGLPTPRAQRKAIVEIGFGGLLHIEITELPGGMNDRLVKNFEPTSRTVSVDGKPLYTVIWADVHDVFMLPYGKDYPVEGYTEEVRAIMTRWCSTYERFPHGRRTKLRHFRAAMMSLTDGGLDFKRMYVLYALVVFLTPISNKTMYYQSLASLIDVDSIVKYDWCSYVLEKTCKALGRYSREWRKQKFFSGCTLFLMLTYMHRAPWQGIPEPRERPLCMWWTVEKLKWRISQELEYQRSIALLVRDLKVVVGNRFQSILNGEGRSVGDIQVHLLGTGSEDMINTRDDHDKIGEPLRFEIFSRNPRDRWEQPTRDVNTAGVDFQGPPEVPIESEEHVSARESGMGVEKEWDALEWMDSNPPREHEAEVPLVGTVKGKGRVGNKEQACMEVPYANTVVEGKGKGKEPVVGGNLEQAIEDLTIGRLMCNNEIAAGSVICRDYCIHGSMPPIKANERVSGITDSTTPDNRLRAPNSHLVRELEQAGVQLTEQTREVVEFCIPGYDRKLVPFTNRICSLDVSTMYYFEIGQRVSEGREKNKVYLKVLQLLEEGLDARMLLLKWSAWVKQWEIDVKKAELIFLPVMLRSSMFLLVVNCRTKQFLYFDCSRRQRKGAAEVKQAAEELKLSFAVWLTDFGHTANVRTFEMVTDDGEWRMSRMSKDDGVFVMHVMETMGGDPSTIKNIQFAKGEDRNFLRESLCSRIILSRVNVNKDIVLAAVRNFIQTKS